MVKSSEFERSTLCELGIVVPVTKLSGNLANLESWLSKLPKGRIQVILVHDVQDTETAPALNQMLNRIQDRRIEYFEGYFGAPGLARNYGMTKLNSNWIWFVDADDIPVLEHVVHNLESTGDDIEILVGQFETDRDGQRTRSRTPISEKYAKIALNPGIWRILFRADIFSKYEFQKFRMAEDQLFLIDVNFFKRRCRFSDDIFYIYFKHPHGQLTDQKQAISELAMTIPVVITEIKRANLGSRKYLEIILARQLGTELKHASKNKIVTILKRDLFLIKDLSVQSQIKVVLTLIKIYSQKIAKQNNE